jgi:hypothetical protein
LANFVNVTVGLDLPVNRQQEPRSYRAGAGLSFKHLLRRLFTNLLPAGSNETIEENICSCLAALCDDVMTC